VAAGASNSVKEIAYVSAPQAVLRDQVAAVYNKAGTVKNGKAVRAGIACAGTHLNRSKDRSNSSRFSLTQLLIRLRRVHLVVSAVEQVGQSFTLRPLCHANAKAQFKAFKMC
jgi:hypothetical protein